MNACIIVRGLEGLVDLAKISHRLEKSMQNRNLDSTATSFNSFARTESSDSIVRWVFSQSDEQKEKGLPKAAAPYMR